MAAIVSDQLKYALNNIIDHENNLATQSPVQLYLLFFSKKNCINDFIIEIKSLELNSWQCIYSHYYILHPVQVLFAHTKSVLGLGGGSGGGGPEIHILFPLSRTAHSFIKESIEAQPRSSCREI